MATIDVQIGGDAYRCGIHKRKQSDGSYVFTVAVDRQYQIRIIKPITFHRSVYTKNHFSLGDAITDLHRVVQNKADMVENNTRIDDTLESEMRELASTNTEIEIQE